MLLMGFAIQGKPTVVFEGAWFGIALLVAAWRARLGVAALTQEAAGLVAVALAPTLVALAAYTAIATRMPGGSLMWNRFSRAA